ncbi:hypothetical protein MCW_01270 [Cardidatus Bartonella washoeensis 085-0475]|uniref:Uncharacterized protein n=1 Tax=Cardidatus Bartonella washoeensis 085-0475 TaxID=1094564 RepID=J0QEA6_9HYPH|nr:hypothetical protein MCW_01270 [Bartonella washoeensis 085-0475]
MMLFFNVFGHDACEVRLLHWSVLLFAIGDSSAFLFCNFTLYRFYDNTEKRRHVSN